MIAVEAIMAFPLGGDMLLSSSLYTPFVLQWLSPLLALSFILLVGGFNFHPIIMKQSVGTFHPRVVLKSVSGRVGVMLFRCGTSNKYKKLDAKLERKLMEVKRNTSGRNNFRSFDSIIMRFPQFKEGLKNMRGVFAQYDEDSNGIIDHEELKKCLQKLQLHLSEEEIEDLFCSCDADGSQGIQFNEFIVLLCLIYLLMEPSTSPQPTSRMASPQLEATFDTIVEAFLFLDNNGDGKLNKKDMVKALNAASPCERSSAHITRTRFKEMDGNRSGMVGIRDFLFALTDWVGLDSDEDIPISGS